MPTARTNNRSLCSGWLHLSKTSIHLMDDSMDHIYLRDSSQNDHQFVNNLTREVMCLYVENTWSDEENQERYYEINSFEQSNTQIISEHNKSIGRITLTQNKNEIIIDAIHLVPYVQGQGIGSKFLHNIIEHAVKQKKSVSLVVLRSNPAKKLYEHLGFVVYDETKERYFMRLAYIRKQL